MESGPLRFALIGDGDRAAAVALLEDARNAEHLSGYGKGWCHQVRILVDRGVRDGSMYVGRLCEGSDDAVVSVLQVALVDASAPVREATIEYLVHHTLWGRGFGTHAARACVALATAPPLVAERVSALVVEGNAASRRVLAKLGFAAEPAVQYSMNGVERVVVRYTIGV
eukprot:TRINITY_DN32926_c0_g1_i1.p2 TRINITY_DN32926_c0_g1~~TRINITY_DN32926_c0_g1_i1.p2  ORF type:complete len:169 (+),score=33.15 TRINITY_DN32926_c0_g1_i1:40-546(+)